MSSAASITAREAASSIRPPKLLQPRPDDVTSRPRVCPAGACARLQPMSYCLTRPQRGAYEPLAARRYGEAVVRRLTLLLTLLAALAFSPAALADIVTSQDHSGRTITFDVRAENVDVEWYAELLRTRCTRRRDRARAVRHRPGRGARRPLRLRGRRLLPPWRRREDHAAGRCATETCSTRSSTSTATTSTPGAAWRATSREPNGSASWWEARGMAQLLEDDKVSHTYSLGWERAIGEIFAEDYAQLHLETPVPDRLARSAVGRGRPRGAAQGSRERAGERLRPAAPRPPVVIERRGALRRRRLIEIPVRAARARAARHLHGPHGPGDRPREDGASLQRRSQGLADAQPHAADRDDRSARPRACPLHRLAAQHRLGLGLVLRAASPRDHPPRACDRSA